MAIRNFLIVSSSLILAACVTAPAPVAPVAPPDTNPRLDDFGHLWIQNAAEYQALSLQVYQAATDALPGYIADTAWSALPGQTAAADLPPAVILDVDETVVSNIEFQMNYQSPFTNMKMHRFNDANVAIPVAGVVEFVAAARKLGVTVFFVTNRPCQLIEDDPDPCPQKRSTIQDLAEIGIPADAGHLLLRNEQGWNREKSVRRQHIATSHRVLMLFGDDLGDFLPCVRTTIYPPCSAAATAASRQRLVDAHRDYWGRAWFVLPNPMHGSWTSAE